jgi:hypothetical protein
MAGQGGWLGGLCGRVPASLTAALAMPAGCGDALKLVMWTVEHGRIYGLRAFVYHGGRQARSPAQPACRGAISLARRRSRWLVWRDHGDAGAKALQSPSSLLGRIAPRTAQTSPCRDRRWPLGAHHDVRCIISRSSSTPPPSSTLSCP